MGFSDQVSSGVIISISITGIDNFIALIPRTVSITTEPSIAELFPLPLLFETPPISKGAIFKSANLSLVEKRNLMKFITTLALQGKWPEEAGGDGGNILVASKVSEDSGPSETGAAEGLSPDRVRAPLLGLQSFLSTASTYSEEPRKLGSGVNRNGSNELTESWISELNRFRLSLGSRQRITYGLCLKNCLESSDESPARELKSTTDWDKLQGWSRLYLIASSFGKYCDGESIQSFMDNSIDYCWQHPSHRFLDLLLSIPHQRFIALILFRFVSLSQLRFRRLTASIRSPLRSLQRY